MASTFIDQSVITGGTGVINVPVPGTALAGDLVIAFGMSQFDDAATDANGYSFGPNVWVATLGSDGLLLGPRISSFCVRKIFAGEANLTLTPLNPGTTNHVQTVLQVWRGAAQFFSGVTGEYNFNGTISGYPSTPASSTDPGTADPTAVFGGNIAFSAAMTLDAVAITSIDLEGFTNSALESNVRIDVRGFTQGEGGSSYPIPVYDLSVPTFWGSNSIGFTGAPEPVSTAEWAIPLLEWSATGAVEPFSPTGGVKTKRFDAGDGQPYYLVAPLVDSGSELRSKVITALHQTGKRTNVNAKVYTYDVGDEINVNDLENGTNSTTGAIPLDDSTQVAQSEREQVNCPNAVLSTTRIEGDDTGEATRDRIDEVVVEGALQGVRR